MPVLDVPLPATPYSITVEPGVLRDLGRIVRDVAPHTRAALVVDANIADVHAPVAREALRDAGFEVVEHVIVAEESRKTLDTVRGLYDTMLAARLERGSPVVALGGGLVGDVAGFAAATYLRGVPLVQAPTTLLAMVDASIGGKTGVNHPLPDGRTGKNLIGAFWQPRAVVVDPSVLRTLDVRHLRCGLAESVKHGLIADAGLLESIGGSVGALLGADEDALASLVARSAAVKVAIVTRDEREAGERALLNLGHTFGHAIEPIAELGVHHGEAVAIGLCADSHCATRTGMLAPEAAASLEGLLESIGLPTRLTTPVDVATLMSAMQFDKKVAGDRLRLVLPRDGGTAVLVDDVPRETVVDTWRHVGARASA